MNLKSRALILAALALVGGCELGTQLASGGGTHVEGLTGSLVIQGGGPASGALVRVYPVANPAAAAKAAADASTEAAALDSVFAAAGGTFAFTDLPAGTYNLAATLRHGDTSLSLFVRAVAYAGVPTDLGTDTLRVSGGLAVQVHSGGIALPGAICTVPASPWESVSDTSGACTLAGLPPGLFQITVSYPGMVVFVSGNLTVTPGTVSDAGNLNLPGGPLAAPVLQGPDYGATGIRTSNPMWWLRVDGASWYQAQVAMDSAFAQVVADDSVPQTAANNATWPVPLLQANTAHYWRVRARNAAGASAWSATWMFITHDGSDTGTTSVPAAPTLGSPAQGATGVSTSASLSWSMATGASIYILRVATDSMFSQIVLLDTLGPTLPAIPFVSHGNVPLQANKAYFWSVRAANAAGPGPWSETRYFITGSGSDTGTLAAPTPLFPKVPVLEQLSTSPTLRWSSVPGATGYQLEVINGTFPTQQFVNDSTLTDTSRVLASLSYLTTYYWRVRARNASGWGPWSAQVSFSIDEMPIMPAAPTPVSPQQFSTGVSTSPVLSWNAVPGATSYRVQVSTNASFTSFVVNDTNTIGTSRNVAGLAANTSYYWRVSAWNAAGSGAYSEVFMFSTGLGGDTTSATVPAVPTPTSPAQFATNIPTSPVLSWNAVTGATYYRVQVSTNASFTSFVVNDTNTIGTSHSVAGLTANATYYWRVSARNAAGASAYSTAFRFTTGPGGDTTSAAVPTAPWLVTPVQFATGVTTPTTLSWNAVTGATSYRVQVSTNASFTALVVNDTNTIGTSRNVAGLAANTSYYWRVSARNAAGTGAYSETYTFITGTGGDTTSAIAPAPSSNTRFARRGATSPELSPMGGYTRTTGEARPGIPSAPLAGRASTAWRSEATEPS